MIEKRTVGRNNAATLMRAIHTQLHYYQLHKQNRATGLAAVTAFHIGMAMQKAENELHGHSAADYIYNKDQISRLRTYVVNAL